MEPDTRTRKVYQVVRDTLENRGDSPFDASAKAANFVRRPR